MRAGKELKIVLNKIEKKTDGEDILYVDYILDGEAKEKISIISEMNDLTSEEKVVFTKFFMIIERLLKSNSANNIVGI